MQQRVEDPKRRRLSPKELADDLVGAGDERAPHIAAGLTGRVGGGGGGPLAPRRAAAVLLGLLRQPPASWRQQAGAQADCSTVDTMTRLIAARLELGEAAPANEPELAVEIFVAAAKPDRIAWLVEKVTEIGVVASSSSAPTANCGVCDVIR